MNSFRQVVMHGQRGGDDAAWIQDEADEIANTGGTLLLHAGTFTLCSTVQIPSLVNVVGQGTGGTVFKSNVAGPAF